MQVCISPGNQARYKSLIYKENSARLRFISTQVIVPLSQGEPSFWL